MHRKSMYKIVLDTIGTFKRSFEGIVFTYLIIAGIFFLISWFLNKYFSIGLQDLKPFIVLPTKISILYVLVLLYIPIVLKIWQILVIKNNLFEGENRFDKAFDAAVLKSLLVICFTFPTLIFFALLTYLFVKVIPSYLPVLPFIMLVLWPIFIVFFMGLILEEGKIKIVIKKSFRAATFHYIRALISLIVLVVLVTMFVLIYTSLTVTFFGLGILASALWLLIPALQALMYIAIDGFIMCYFIEVFYAFAVEDEEKFDINASAKEDKKKKTPENNTEETSSEDQLKGVYMLGSSPTPQQTESKTENPDKTEPAKDNSAETDNPKQ